MRLDVDGMLQSLEPARLRRLCVAGVIVRAIGWCAHAAGAGDHALDLIGADHPRVVADMHGIAGPIEVDARDMWGSAQLLLDRLRALKAVNIV